MDPLSRAEIEATVRIIKEQTEVGEGGLYPLITVQDPPKNDPERPHKRLAFVLARKRTRDFQGIINITDNTLQSWKEVEEDKQPNFLMSEEWSLMQRIVRGDSAWRAAIKKRGISDLSEVVCVPNTIGHYTADEGGNRRLVKVVSYLSDGVSNYWSRPIEGLIALVDLEQLELIELIDTGTVPIPQGRNLDSASIGRQRELPGRIVMQQEGDPGYSVEGHVVRWQKWKFHFRMDPRVGLVVSDVTYNDDGNVRSVLYQGALSELSVPYMDPGASWYFRTYLDAGEYGIGKLAVTLHPGLDCPENAKLFNVVFADDWGDPYELDSVVCLFERYAGIIAWRHSESVTGTDDVRRGQELVLRSISAIGNYDYVFDWVFRQDGTIRVGVGASGIEQVKAVKSRTAADDKSGEDTAFGHMVADHTLAVNHDHFFCYKLDLDIDGSTNTFQYDRLVTDTLPEDSPRKTIWRISSHKASTEQEARMRINLRKPALWRVINPGKTGPMGYPVSYHLKPMGNALPLLDPDDPVQQQAGFTDYHLWVTPYDPENRYAAGLFPNQSQSTEGLPLWTRENRNIANTDIVLWYTVGFHHVVRAEDWPVLPVGWHEFELRPFDFFRQNPALDLPK